MDFTSIIILGTHLDLKEHAVVTEEHILGAKDFVRGFILSKKDTIQEVDRTTQTDTSGKAIINYRIVKVWK
ncbi:MAG: hypothetical protein ACTSXO_03605 [Candidatus Heimdallarchaeota archaeon]|nr:MAG: hypothetical protein DRP02_08890 [Candidatus Gerdarchaeota archaeon]